MDHGEVGWELSWVQSPNVIPLERDQSSTAWPVFVRCYYGGEYRSKPFAVLLPLGRNGTAEAQRLGACGG